MRLLLFLYVVVCLTLNFFMEEPLFFFLAMSAFPVMLYLLLSRPKARKKNAVSPADPEKKQQPVEEKSSH